MDYFTGGCNLNHLKSIEYYNRPFKTTDEMNNTILNNINNMVKSNDRLYICGNFCFAPIDPDKFIRTTRYFRNKINCDNIFLVYGNHDRRGAKMDEFLNLWTRSADYMELKGMEDRSLILFCYEIKQWNRQHRGGFHLYSYPHGKGINSKGASADVSIDNVKYLLTGDDAAQEAEWYRPISYTELKKVLEPKASVRDFSYQDD